MIAQYVRYGLLAACALGGSALQAQPTSAPTPYVSGGVDLSNDSDHFNEYKPWAQYEWASGWGVRAGWQRYRLDDWSATGRSLWVTHRVQSDTITSNARVGINRTGGHDHLVGLWDGMYQFTPSTAAGMSLERDVVNSRWGIEDGLMVNTAMLVLDHTFNPRLSVGVAAGSSWFSDSNRRDIVRTRWNLTLSEEKGWYTYLTTRHFWFTDPYHYAYFSPDRFGEASLGLMWKTRITDDVVLSANIDAGRQSIDGESKPVWGAGLYLQSPHRAALQWKVGLTTRKDHASPLGGTAESYRYTSAVGSVRVPF